MALLQKGAGALFGTDPAISTLEQKYVACICASAHDLQIRKIQQQTLCVGEKTIMVLCAIACALTHCVVRNIISPRKTAAAVKKTAAVGSSRQLRIYSISKMLSSLNKMLSSCENKLSKAILPRKMLYYSEFSYLGALKIASSTMHNLLRLPANRYLRYNIASSPSIQACSLMSPIAGRDEACSFLLMSWTSKNQIHWLRLHWPIPEGRLQEP